MSKRKTDEVETGECPVCQQPLTSQRGSQIDPNDGVTVYCPHLTCPAQEVSGHGDSVQAGLKIIAQKFNRKFPANIDE